MNRIGELFSRLTKSIARSKMALAGGAIASVLFPMLFVSVVLDLVGWVENPYFSFLLYLALTPLLIIAIILTTAGIYHSRGENRYSFESFKDHLTTPERYRKIRLHAYCYTIFASSFLFFLGIVAVSSQRYSASTSFCANFCHKVMAPAYITYKNSPHSQVPCVACHAGKNSPWLVRRQLTGLHQLYVALTDSYARPLKTPVNHLRPSRETCEQCHWPDKFHGHRLRLIDKFLDDETNSHMQTAILMKIGSGGQLGRPAQGIHWHTSKQHRLYFEATDEERREITRVILIMPDGSSTTYFKNGIPQPEDGGKKRLMDCIDCHNRPTHFLLSPDRALNDKLLTGQIPAELPYIKRVALKAITRDYKNTSEAHDSIAAQLRQWYAVNLPELPENQRLLIDQAIKGTQQAYSENIFPDMNVRWDTYPDFIGHRQNSGCFRCHDGSFKSSDGTTISHDCKLCHLMMAESVPVEKVMDAVVRGRKK
ncbi:MAG: hypothetical protein Q7W05_02180 [Deltaproteobacteria bacterium]|nr:hypothetical protein [Deltaproteobacteria bacterium]